MPIPATTYKPVPPDPFNDHTLEGLTVCVNYADFLDHTLRHNLAAFQRFVVVTSFDDYATQGVCQKHSVECVQTDVMFEYGSKFNKGAAINLGLAYLRQTGWILHLDSDVILPDRFRNLLDKTPLQRDSVYGALRVNIRSYEQFRKHLHDQWNPQFHHKYLLDTPEECPPGATLIHREYGYCPIGYFQLWHGSQHKRYPAVHNSAEHDDVLHALQWPRAKRHMLPSVRVFHLESESAGMGANWGGRKTKHFGPA